MRNISGKINRENHNTHFMFLNFFLKVLPFVRESKQKLNKKANVEKYSIARQAT